MKFSFSLNYFLMLKSQENIICNSRSIIFLVQLLLHCNRGWQKVCNLTATSPRLEYTLSLAFPLFPFPILSLFLLPSLSSPLPLPVSLSLSFKGCKGGILLYGISPLLRQTNIFLCICLLNVFSFCELWLYVTFQ